MADLQLLSNIRIILVETSHPGNIGSVARAMKTMGISELYLVSPKLFPHTKASELAAGADDILAQAVVVSSLQEALSPCNLIIGTSSRRRALPLPYLIPAACGKKVIEARRCAAKVGIVFGCENSGLSNAQLACCHYQLIIPANCAYSSLNLSAAVQIICYEIYQANLMSQENKEAVLGVVKKQYDRLANAQEVEQFYQHLQRTLEEIDLLRPHNPKRIMSRLKRMFSRIHLEYPEVQLLRGILRAIHKLKLNTTNT